MYTHKQIDRADKSENWKIKFRNAFFCDFLCEDLDFFLKKKTILNAVMGKHPLLCKLILPYIRKFSNTLTNAILVFTGWLVPTQRQM